MNKPRIFPKSLNKGVKFKNEQIKQIFYLLDMIYMSII